VLVGGQDVSSIRQSDLRSQVAYVPQDPVMFHRSLRDNIAFGRLDASDEEIRAAAAASHAAELIEALPAGYDTIIGERGVKLSGGQRQRSQLPVPCCGVRRSLSSTRPSAHSTPRARPSSSAPC
jgi:ATP-binding cassette subfamily B protein